MNWIVDRIRRYHARASLDHHWAEFEGNMLCREPREASRTPRSSIHGSRVINKPCSGSWNASTHFLRPLAAELVVDLSSSSSEIKQRLN